jgi:hypothetical protein
VGVCEKGVISGDKLFDCWVRIVPDPVDTICACEHLRERKVRKGRTVRIGVFYGECECFRGISASVAPPEDDPGNQETENEEANNYPANDGADTDLL